MWENARPTKRELFGFELSVFKSASSRKNISVPPHALRKWTISGRSKRPITIQLALITFLYNRPLIWLILAVHSFLIIVFLSSMWKQCFQFYQTQHIFSRCWPVWILPVVTLDLDVTQVSLCVGVFCNGVSRWSI